MPTNSPSKRVIEVQVTEADVREGKRLRAHEKKHGKGQEERKRQTQRKGRYFEDVNFSIMKGDSSSKEPSLSTSRGDLLSNCTGTYQFLLNVPVPKVSRIVKDEQRTGIFYPPPLPEGDARFHLHSPFKTPNTLSIIYSDGINSPGRNLTAQFKQMAVNGGSPVRNSLTANYLMFLLFSSA